MRPGHLAELAVERAQWQVPSLARNLQYKAIGKSKRWFGAELSKCGRDNVGILQSQVGMRHQSLHGVSNLLRRAFTDRVENPKRFHEHHVRYPCALASRPDSGPSQAFRITSSCTITLVVLSCCRHVR